MRVRQREEGRKRKNPKVTHREGDRKTFGERGRERLK